MRRTQAQWDAYWAEQGRTPEDADQHESENALLAILRHEAIVKQEYLGLLAKMAVEGKSERHRLRAMQALLKAQRDAATALAEIRGDREASLAQRGLSKNSTTVEITHKLQDIPLEQLKRLAGSAPAPIVVDAEITDVPAQGVPSGRPADPLVPSSPPVPAPTAPPTPDSTPKDPTDPA